MIHNGETEASVHIELDTGALITRKRKAGKSTQLAFISRTGRPTATQKRAQELINDYMKMSLADFDASCFIEQKQIARMVTASPADRTKIVNAWLELGPLQDAAGYASDHLRTLLASKSQNAQAQETSLAAFEDFDVEGARAKAAKMELQIAGMVDLRRVIKDEIQVGIDWRRQKRRSDEFENALEMGKEQAGQVTTLEAELAALDDDATLEKAAEDAAVEVVMTRELHNSDKSLAEGEFDGQCPVMHGKCPARDEVVESKDYAKRRLPQHIEDVDQRRIAYDNVMTLKANRATAERELENCKRDLDAIRTIAQDRSEAADFIAENPTPIDTDGQMDKESQYDDDIADLKVEKSMLETAIKSYEAAQKTAAEHGPAAQKLDDDIRTAREAVAILGRGGAQKEVASSALTSIETLANGLLSQASIDLTIAVRWAREGKGLASHCDACGAPFGTSARVKVCPGCNAARGPKMIEKLELDLSNRSGAADDMAGLAFQLAASSWLRRKRGSDWSVVFIDEPFGALDETNARNLSSHLHTLIRGAFGFEQGFLVAHSASIMGAMPARVVVKSDGVSSSLEVE
jgi:DNA repair exonuclease SbcCD ATPase subunit